MQIDLNNRINFDEKIVKRKISVDKISEISKKLLLFAILGLQTALINTGYGLITIVPSLIIYRKIFSKEYLSLVLIISLMALTVNEVQALCILVSGILLYYLSSERKKVHLYEYILLIVMTSVSYLLANINTYSIEGFASINLLSLLFLVISREIINIDYSFNKKNSALSELISLGIFLSSITYGLIYYSYNELNIGYMTTILTILLLSRTRNSVAIIYSLINMIIFTLTSNIESALIFPVIALIYSQYKNRLLSTTFHISFVFAYIWLQIGSELAISLYIMNVIPMLVYFMLPKKYLNNLSKINLSEYDSIKTKLQEDVSNKLLNFSEVFDIFAEKSSQSYKEISSIDEAIDEVIIKHCNKCVKRNACLNNNHIKTYTYFNKLVREGEYILDIDRKGLLDLFGNFCINAFEVVNTCIYLNQNYNISEVDGTKPLVFESYLKGLSSIIKSYAYEFDENSNNNIIDEDVLMKEIKKERFVIKYFKKFSLYKNNINFEIGLEKSTNFEINHFLTPLLERLLKEEIEIIINQNVKGMTIIKINSQKRLNVQFGASFIGKNGARLSGDNYMQRYLPDGNMVIALSDGMGSGFSANQESKTTIEILNKILNTGVNNETAVTMINTLIALKEYNERYSTLDYVVINQSSGEASFYKIGATTSFILRNNKVRKIDNNNLPVGIEINITNEKIKIQENDYIIMVSDGVIERIDDIKIFEQLLIKIPKSNCTQIAKDILREVINIYNGKIIDDMTVIVVKADNTNKKIKTA